MADPLRLLLAALVLTAAVWDLRSRRIPNALTVHALAAGVALRGLAGGDVKLMAAAGVMTGSRSFVAIFLLNAMLGGIVALILVDIGGGTAVTLPRGPIFAIASLAGLFAAA